MFMKFNRRGQVMVLYALLIPLLFLFVGVGMDLGWYYLNVSRLQNAADAAALAGAQALVRKNHAFADYYVVSLASNALPENFEDYENAFNHNFGTLNNYKTQDEVKGTFIAGRDLVEEYIRKNLSDDAEVSSSDERKNVSATDGWSISVKDEDRKVTGDVELRYKIMDAKNDIYGSLYYVVNLTEKIRHFFLPGWFDDMQAPVRAVVLLQPNERGLITPMDRLASTMVIDNWEEANRYKGTTGFYAGNWNHYMSGTFKQQSLSDGKRCCKTGFQK